MTPRQAIYETPDLVVIGQEFPGDTIFVSFNDFGFAINGVRFSDDNFFLKAKAPSIGIVTAKPDWYPPEHMAPAITAILAAANGRRIVTYGHSHGGYGALKYASAFGAFAALAFNPQYAIDPAIVSDFDKRFARYFDTALSSGSPITDSDLCPVNYVVFDPYEAKDQEHAKRIIAGGGHKILPVIAPMTQDRTNRLLAEADFGAAFFALFAEATPPPAAALRNLLRAARAKSDTYATGRAETLLRLRPKKLALTERIARAMPADKNQIPLIKTLVAGYRFDEALEILEATPTAAKTRAGLLNLAKLFRETEFTAGELHLAPLIMEHFTGRTGEYLQAVAIYLRNGDLKNAGAALQTALTFSGAVDHVRLIVDYATKIRRHDLCEAALDLFLADTRLPISQKIREGVSFAAACAKFGARYLSVRCLRNLWEMCGDDENDLKRIADALYNIHEYSMALGIRSKLLSRDPNNMVRRLEVIEVLSRIKLNDARSEIAEIMETPQDNFEFWERVSISKHQVGDTAGAIDATHEAMARGANELQSRRRLAALHAHQHNYFAAKSEIRKILSLPGIEPHVLRDLADKAVDAEDPELALACAQRQFDEAGDDPDAVYYVIRILGLTGNSDAAIAQLTKLCDAPGSFHQTNAGLWVAVAEEAARYGREDLELRLVEHGLSHHPTDQQLMERHAGILVKQKVLGVVKKSAPPEPKKRKSFMAKFLRTS